MAEPDFVDALRRGDWSAAAQASDPWTGEALVALVKGYVLHSSRSRRQYEHLRSLFEAGLAQIGDVEAMVGWGDLIDHLQEARAQVGPGPLSRQLSMVEDLVWKKLTPSRLEARLQVASEATKAEATGAWKM